MAENKFYLALGEEAARGVKESTTVGFVPLLAPGIPRMEFDEKKREEFRGEDSLLGDSGVVRLGRKWTTTLEMPVFTEAGGSKGAVGTILKHFFGKAVTTENGTTGQFSHMLYPVADPFSAVNLGARALTLNLNLNEGQSMMNWPFVGGRVRALTFVQEPGSHLKLSCDTLGQFRDSPTAEIGGQAYAPENLRCDYNNLKVYTGAITRTGTGPDYTGFSFGSATQIRPDRLTLKIENGMEDTLRLSGLDYADRTRMGRFRLSLELTIDWEDPASGFSSVDEFNSWASAGGERGFCLHWDTGTQAGAGDNHGLFIDIPRARRTGGEPDYRLDRDPMITLRYEGLLDSTTTGYIAGVLLRNTASAV